MFNLWEGLWMVYSRWGKNVASVAAFLSFFVLFEGCFKSITTSNASRTSAGDPDESGMAGFSGGSIPGPVSVSPTLRSVTPLVRSYSERYNLDWVLVLALVRQESGFDHGAVSHRGAYGLMQLMPTTQIELTEKLGMDEAMTPANNIRAGIYHLKTLYEYFDQAPKADRIRLSLAAYNAGLGRIIDAQRIAEYLGNDPNSWEAVRDAMPYLSKKYYTLHASIWTEKKPSSGYMRNYRETQQYVDGVIRHYEDYSLAVR